VVKGRVFGYDIRVKIEEIKSPLPSRVPQGVKESVAQKLATGEAGKVVEGGKKSSTKMVSQVNEPEKKKMAPWIKIAGVGVVVVVVGLGLVSLLGKTGKKKEPAVTLNYWGLWEEEAVVEGVIADFESKNPEIKVNYTKSFQDNYRSRLAGRLEKDATQVEVPDVFRIHASWLPMFTDKLAPVPKSTAQGLGLEEDFYDVYKRDLKRDGAFLAIPLMYDGLSLFYNKKLLEAGGVKLPKTWWGLESAAEKLTVRDEAGKIQVAGAALGFVENVDHWSDIVGLMMKQNGVELEKDSVDSNKKLENVLAFYTLFATKTKSWDEYLPASTQLFASGNLVFYFAPSWRVFDIEQMNPDLEYGITTVPQLPTLENVPPDQIDDLSAENLTNVHWSSYWVEGVNNKSKNRAEAFAFLEYLASKEGLDRMYKTASQIRAFGEINPRKSMMAGMKTNDKVKAFVEAADYASTGWTCSRTFDDGLNDQMNQYFKDAINSMVLGKSRVEAVAPDLRNGINQLVLKYQLNY